jgi:hypothetical protein
MGRPKKIQPTEQTTEQTTQPTQPKQPTKTATITAESDFSKSSNNNDETIEKIKALKDDHDLNKQFEESKKERKKRSANYTYKSKKVIEQEKEEFAQSIAGVGSFAMNLICERLPNPKPLTVDEAKNFDYLFGKVIYKYSETLGNYQEETALLSVALMIIVPRMKKPKEIKENEKPSN